MKKKLLQILLLFSFIGIASAKTDNSIIDQGIIYKAPSAEEVYIVWGVNNWHLVNKDLYPEGTAIDKVKNIMWSPMHKQGDHEFYINLKTNAGDIIDHVFWIKKAAGIASDTWDINAPNKDYHTKAGENQTVYFTSKIKKIDLSTADVKPFDGKETKPFLICLYLLGAIAGIIFLRKKILKQSFSFRPSISILAASLTVGMFLVYSRAMLIGFDWKSLKDFISLLPSLLAFAYDDIIYASGLAFIFIVLNYLLRRSTLAQKINFGVFSFIAFVSMMASYLNIRVVQVLGKPFNYQWLYYSDFFQSSDSKSAFNNNVDKAYFISIAGMICLYIIIQIWLALLIRPVFKIKYLKIAGITIFSVGSILYVPYARKYLDTINISRGKIENPVVSFMSSLNIFSSTPSLFSISIEENEWDKKWADNPKPIFEKNNKIKNVVIYVLESTPSIYLDVYGGKYNITPNLTKYSSNAVIFDNIYAHAPATNKSLVSMMSSLYPWLSYNSITQEHPDINLPSISSELKDKGYKTAFFNAGDNNFQNLNKYLSHRKFDKVVDINVLKDCKRFTVEKWKDLDGLNDECILNEFSSWASTEKDKPFFSILWTYQTHYPYFVEGEPKKIVEDDSFNKYLNAVSHSDYVFGQLMEYLYKNNLQDETLVVVVGDHGEAFKQHQQLSHATKIYEENIKIPLIFFNPMFKGERKNVTGGMVDVSPTIFHVLNQTKPDVWQGSSLLSDHHKTSAYFFCPWSDYYFGCRTENYKYIYDALNNKTEIYDLTKDPGEKYDLSSERPDLADKNFKRVAAWAQYQDKYVKGLFNRK